MARRHQDRGPPDFCGLTLRKIQQSGHTQSGLAFKDNLANDKAFRLRFAHDCGIQRRALRQTAEQRQNLLPHCGLSRRGRGARRNSCYCSGALRGILCRNAVEIAVEALAAAVIRARGDAGLCGCKSLHGCIGAETRGAGKPQAGHRAKSIENPTKSSLHDQSSYVIRPFAVKSRRGRRSPAPITFPTEAETSGDFPALLLRRFAIRAMRLPASPGSLFHALLSRDADRERLFAGILQEGFTGKMRRRREYCYREAMTRI